VNIDGFVLYFFALKEGQADPTLSYWDYQHEWACTGCGFMYFF